MLPSAKITPRRSEARGGANLGWLDSRHTFSVAGYYDPEHMQFGAMRVLNEDRVAPGTGFPNHHHREMEIFSYILSGELTHRDSTHKGEANKNLFYRMHRGDVQMTTGGRGITHSEQNEAKDWVHFLQIWILPWKKGLTPIYHTETFSEEEKRKDFVPIITPLKAGPNATPDEEKIAAPAIDKTIPIHADVIFSAAIIEKGKMFRYTIGNVALSKMNRKVYVHFPSQGKAQIRLDSLEILDEGDGAYVSNVNAGDILTFENIGDADAEVVVIDSN